MGWSAEARAAAAARMRARNADPAFRSIFNRPEVRARKSAAMKLAMADPEVRARHAAAMADPEVRAKLSAARRDPWLAQLDPDERKLYRKMVNAGVPWRAARRQIDRARIKREGTEAAE